MITQGLKEEQTLSVWLTFKHFFLIWLVVWENVCWSWRFYNMQMHPGAAGCLCFHRRQVVKGNGCEDVVSENNDIANSYLFERSSAENMIIYWHLLEKSSLWSRMGTKILIIQCLFLYSVKKHLNASVLFIFWENIWTLKHNLCPFIPSSTKCEFYATSPKLIKSQSVQLVYLLWCSGLG